MQEIQDTVRRKEIDKNFKESDINNLKPEIKLLQTEKGAKLRCIVIIYKDVAQECVVLRALCVQYRGVHSCICIILKAVALFIAKN